MRADSLPQPATAAEYRICLHELNQRYRQEWQRAERLQDELDNIKRSRAYRLLRCWRQLVALWPRSKPNVSTPISWPTESLEAERVPAAGSVSIVIPFKDRVELLRTCLRGLRRGTYRPVHVILVDNGSTCRRTLRYLDRLERFWHRRSGERLACGCPTSDKRDARRYDSPQTALSSVQVLPSRGPFNFSRLCNTGAQQAESDFLVFLNNDVEVLDTDWLEQLLQLANSPGIGIAGGTLLYPDGTLQHAGIFPDADGNWTHSYRGEPQDFAGIEGELRYARTVPAVTGACLCIRRDLFAKLGGFDERLAVTFNDVDLCCRVRGLGLRVAISPRARLWHYESLSRGYARGERVYHGG